MRVTIAKTIELKEIPLEIDELYESIAKRLVDIQDMLGTASSNAKEGRYIQSSENIETIRQLMMLLDKNLEEQQSLSLSYEKLRISKQMPEKQTAATSPMVGNDNNE